MYVDPVKYSSQDYEGFDVALTYIAKPISFTDTIVNWRSTILEVNDSMAEELISLALVFALENVESPRLTSKIQTKGLEA